MDFPAGETEACDGKHQIQEREELGPELQPWHWLPPLPRPGVVRLLCGCRGDSDRVRGWAGATAVAGGRGLLGTKDRWPSQFCLRRLIPAIRLYNESHPPP